MAEAKEELIEYSYGKTVCQRRPEMCEPRRIHHVAWDADDTMWHIDPMTIASHISGPLKLIDPDTVEATGGREYPVTPTVTGPPPERPPVTQTFNPKTGKWEWEHEKKGKQMPLGFRPEKEEVEDWWITKMGASKEETEELQAITEELYGSMPEDVRETLEIAGELKPPTPPAQEVVFLDDIQGWKKRQAKAVDRLINRYGKKVCEVVEVHSDGDITVDCRGDVWVVTTDGQSFLEQDKFGEKRGREGKRQQPSKKPKTVYQPKPIIIKLLPTFRDTLDKLEEKGITSSVISLNAPGSVKRILATFGLADRFIEIKDTWENKGKVFDEIAKRNHLNPCNVMFVDNSITHVEEVVKKCGLALQIGKGKDVERPIEILNYIENHHAAKERD